MLSVTSPDVNRQTIGNYRSTVGAILKEIIVHSLWNTMQLYKREGALCTNIERSLKYTVKQQKARC